MPSFTTLALLILFVTYSAIGNPLVALNDLNSLAGVVEIKGPNNVAGRGGSAQGLTSASNAGIQPRATNPTFKRCEHGCGGRDDDDKDEYENKNRRGDKRPVETVVMKAKGGNMGSSEHWKGYRSGGKKGRMSKHGKRGGTGGDGWHSPFVFSRVGPVGGYTGDGGDGWHMRRRELDE